MRKKAFSKTAQDFDKRKEKRAYRKRQRERVKQGRPKEYDETHMISLTAT